MEIKLHFGTQLLLMSGLFSISVFFRSGSCDPAFWACNKEGSCNVGVGLVESSKPDIIGCLSCSQEYLTGSNFDNYNSLIDSEFHSSLAREIGTSDLCKDRVDSISVLGLSDLFRHLSGEGSHRHLVSTFGFCIRSDVLSRLDQHTCEAVIIERLPTGVFADPFELQHLVNHGVFLSAAVFGDTNLELPSALSNRSIVEIHIDIGRAISSKCCETVVQLPLHARYPPLDSSGYASIKFGRPDLFLRCRPKNVQNESCSWALSYLGARSINIVTWQVPCGSEAHAGLVSGITFVSALVCSLLIVIFPVCSSGRSDIKES